MKNHMGKENAAKKSKQPEEFGAATATVATTACGGLWSWQSHFPALLHFGASLGQQVLPWIACRGPIGLLLQTFMTWFGLNFSIFS